MLMDGEIFSSCIVENPRNPGSGDTRPLLPGKYRTFAPGYISGPADPGLTGFDSVDLCT